MARKVFISVLGFSNYAQCVYVKDGYKSPSVRFIQEATLDYLCQNGEWTDKDAVYILLTKGAERNNWQNDGHKDKNTGEIIKCEGLCSRLQQLRKPFKIYSINNLPDGNNEEEIWNIFESVFSVIEEGDELYFDLTHGFRYLPMLIMVLINYSKFLKNTSVKSITYGNFDSRNRETNEAPIIDLLPLSTLQDWTYAAGQLLESGNVQNLTKLSKQHINPILRNSAGVDLEASLLKKIVVSLETCIEDMQTCRGVNIVKATTLKSLKNEITQLQKTFIKPLNPIFDKIKSCFMNFVEEEDVKNGFLAAKWCLDNNLYQQAITILQESIITLICVEQGFDYKDKTLREIVSKAFNIVEKERPERDWKFPSSLTEKELEDQKRLIRVVMKSGTLKQLCSSFAVCTSIRNDFNHAGMGDNPSKSSRLKLRIKEQIERVLNMLYDYLLINLTNHPSEQWDERQLAAAKEFGVILDMPFPDISDTADEKYISNLADEYFKRILDLRECHNVTVHLMGEFSFTVALLKRLQQHGIRCVASTSKRLVEELSPGNKEVFFQFERFREYE